MRGPLLAALLVFCSAPAVAMEIDLVDVPTVTFTGRAVRVAVELIDPEEDIKGITLQADPSLTVKGPFSRGRNVRVINGERSVSFAVEWELTPGKAGRFAFGPITIVTASGKRQQQALSELRVLEQAPKGVSKLLVKALAGGPVGYPFRVEYTLLTAEKRFESRGTFGDARYPYGLQGLDLALLKAGLPWTPFKVDPDRQASELRIGEDATLLVQESIAEWNGHGYYATTFGVEATARAPGVVDLSAAATLQVVGGTKRARDFFGRVQEVPSGVQRTVRSDPLSYRVADLPPGAPPGFSGAVGRYTLSASCAVSEANAFDPIEVTIRIEGEGLLEDVSLPAWQDMPEISASFQVATDVDPGKLIGKTKVFTKVFRAKGAHVTSLPALPFPHFDPKSERYVVAHSDPIALTIREVKTVTAADAVGGSKGAVNGAGAPVALVAREGIGANYVTLGDQRPELAPPTRFGALLWAVAAAPPLLFLVWLLTPLLSAKVAGGPSPLSEAMETIAPGTLEAVRAGLQGYVSRRLELGGEVTAAELEQALRARVVGPEVVERAVEFWRQLEAARFSGGGDVPPGVAEVLRELDGSL